jgi:hypothetical protein
VAPSTAHKWVSAGLADIPRHTAEELRTMMMEQCNTIMQKLMPLMGETALKGRQPDSSRHPALASSMCGTGPTGTINARSRPLIPQTTVFFGWRTNRTLGQDAFGPSGVARLALHPDDRLANTAVSRTQLTCRGYWSV